MAEAGRIERQIENAVVRYAEGNGWLVRKMLYPNRRGCPDRWFFHPKRNGRPLVIEFKRPGEKPRKDQEREIARLRDAGIEVHVIDSSESGKAVLDGLG